MSIGRDTADRILSDLVALGGAGPVVVELERCSEVPLQRDPGVVQIGVHRDGELPQIDKSQFDILLSADLTVPEPWIGVGADILDLKVDELCRSVARQPVSAAVVAQVLRINENMPFAPSLLIESIGYSMLLASQGFREWRMANPSSERPNNPMPRVLSGIDQGTLTITLNRPDARNAFDARMRDELVEALEFGAHRSDLECIELRGAGEVFSAGGDLHEFGSADDVGTAHLIRTLQSPARLVHDLGARLTARLHGACIGAGIEIPAAAGRVTARAGTFFRLPEISMGLIPGAGGTASIPRRIGRHRTCYMAISGAVIDLQTALAWELVDEIEK